jgi:hypothetical protein
VDCTVARPTEATLVPTHVAPREEVLRIEQVLALSFDFAKLIRVGEGVLHHRPGLLGVPLRREVPIRAVPDVSQLGDPEGVRVNDRWQVGHRSPAIASR